MKIALIIMNLELGGGAEHDVVNLSTGLKGAGHDPLVITSGGRLCDYLAAEGVHLIRQPVDRRAPRQLWKNACRLADIAAECQIGALNPQGIFPAITAHLASRRLARRGILIPNVVTIHMLSKLTWSCYKTGAFLLNHCADHVIFESQCELDRLRNHGFRGPHTVVPNCFPRAKLSRVTESREEIRRDIGAGQDRVLFVMPARMTPEKRHDLLLQAVAGSQVRSLPVQFYLAGDGPLLDEYKRRATEAGLGDMVLFGGFRKDMPRLYRAADVFLLCSSKESLPLSIREGMAASLPVISTDVGGVSEAVEDGQSGLLVPSGNVDRLSQAIARLATEPDLRRQMGMRGTEIYQRKFDYDNWITRTVEVMSAVRDRYIDSRAGGPTLS